jgi:hypothetical protein
MFLFDFNWSSFANFMKEIEKTKKEKTEQKRSKGRPRASDDPQV